MKKNNMKKVVVTSFVLMMAIGLTGCGNNQKLSSEKGGKDKIPLGDDSNLIGGDAVPTPIILGKKEFSVIGDINLISPKNITVEKNDEITLRFKSHEGTLKLIIDAFDVQTGFSSGGDEEVIFVADKKGEFPIYIQAKNGAPKIMGSLTVQ